MNQEERRREMDREMASIMANHKTILANQEYVITQLHHYHDCLEKMKAIVAQNTEVTEEVRELLATFKVFGRFTKWGAVTGAGALSIWQATKAFFHFWK